MDVVFPPIPAGDRIDVSASTYMTYRRCPAQTGARLEGIYPAESMPSFKGSLAHRLFSHHLRTGPIADDEFEQVCKQEIGSSNLNMKMGELGVKPGVLAGVIEELKPIYERFRAYPTEGLVDAEVLLTAEPGYDVGLMGSVDAIFDEPGGGVRLVDWKTGELGDAAGDQLAFYTLLWLLERGELPARVEAISVGTGERFSQVPTPVEVEEVVAVVADLVTAIRASWDTGAPLPTIAGPWCRWCPILEGCEDGIAAMSLLDDGG